MKHVRGPRQPIRNRERSLWGIPHFKPQPKDYKQKQLYLGPDISFNYTSILAYRRVCLQEAEETSSLFVGSQQSTEISHRLQSQIVNLHLLIPVSVTLTFVDFSNR